MAVTTVKVRTVEASGAGIKVIGSRWVWFRQSAGSAAVVAGHDPNGYIGGKVGGTRMRWGLFLLIGLGSAAALADEAARPRGPLAAMPSEAGPHIEKIKALGDNEWL